MYIYIDNRIYNRHNNWSGYKLRALDVFCCWMGVLIFGGSASQNVREWSLDQ